MVFVNAYVMALDNLVPQEIEIRRTSLSRAIKVGAGTNNSPAAPSSYTPAVAV